jgi:hypothetical protein
MSRFNAKQVVLVVAAAIVSSGAQSLPVRTTDANTVQQFFGTRNVKLAFALSMKGIYYIDFSETAPAPHLLPQSVGGMLPVISPDGQWVTYQKGVNGDYAPDSITKASAWVQQLNETSTPIKVTDTGFVPRFVQNAPTQPTVIYATASYSPMITDSYTFRGHGKMIKAVYSGGAWERTTVWAGGSYLGGLSYDNRYFAHAEQRRNAWMFDLDNCALGPARLHAFSTTSGQACNSSVSSSRIFTNAMMYFDFGGNFAPLGGIWGVHERLFISRNDGSVLRYFAVPADIPVDANGPGNGEVTSVEWNYPEWSNYPYFAAATTQLERYWASGSAYLANEIVYGLDLRQSARNTRLVASTDTVAGSVSFRNPWVWVEVPAGFSEDPSWLLTPAWTATTPVEHPYPAPCLSDTITPSAAPSATPTPAATPTPSPVDDHNGCGKGFGLAFIPPVGFRIAGFWRKGKKTKKNSLH